MEEERQTPTMRESLETSGEIVAQSPTLKTLLSAMGGIVDAGLSGSPAPLGNALSTWLVSRADEIEKRRMEEQFVLLIEQLKALEDRAVRRDFFETEEGRDMLFKALDEARRTRSSLKKELFALILKGSILDFENREYSSEEYLYLISDLTDQEIRVALSIYKEQLPLNLEPEQMSAVWKAWAGKVGDQLEMDTADLRFALGRIVSSGLLDRVTMHESDNTSYFNEPSENEVGLYRITPGFKKLMKFIEWEG